MNQKRVNSRTTLILVVFLLPAVAFGQAFDGLTLYNPINNRTTYLKNNSGQTVNSWTSTNPCYIAYLLPDSTIWRMEVYSGSIMRGGPYGGLMTHYDWSHNLLESFLWSDSNHQQHHDINVMPNGHVLLIAWVRKSRAEGLAMGRLNLTGEIWPDEVIEWDPEADSVVWRWSFWDHLIQDVDPGKPNYGVVREHPELLDINQGTIQQGGDWMHCNAVDYNVERDEIIITSHTLSEFYVIDHSTTTEEARGHTGGRHGRGGDFLYRWGNPQVYDRGTTADQVFFVAHGANWVQPGMPGAGNILVLNNGDRPGTTADSSSIVEITPPLDSNDHYYIHPDSAFGPRTPTWQYSNGTNFYSQHLGGAYRLPNGNTLATLGTTGRLVEVSPNRQVVWQYNTGTQTARAMKYPLDLAGICQESAKPMAVKPAAQPNPFRLSTVIRYALPATSHVLLSLFDAAGRLCTTLIDRKQSPGHYEVIFPAGRREIPAGVYFAQLFIRPADGTGSVCTVKLTKTE